MNPSLGKTKQPPRHLQETTRIRYDAYCKFDCDFKNKRYANLLLFELTLAGKRGTKGGRKGKTSSCARIDCFAVGKTAKKQF